MPPKESKTRIGFISDVHLHNHSKFGGALVSGINRRCRAILDALDRLVEIAHERRLDSIVIAGDLFDVANPTPQVMARLLAVMAKFRGSWVIVKGNHDIRSNQIGDHALGPLRFGERIVVAERAGLVRDPVTDAPLVYAVPFQPGPALDWFPKDFPSGIPVAFHLGVIDDETPEFLRKSDDAIAADRLMELMEEHEVPAMFAGNWHTFHQWQTTRGHVVQMGAFAPKTTAEVGPHYGNVAIYDSAKQQVESVVGVPGPRFIRAETIDEFDSALAELGEVGADVFVEYEHGEEGLGDVYTRLDQAMKSSRIVDYKVIPMSATVEEIDDTVAAAIMASASFEQAVDEYIGGMLSKRSGPFQTMTEDQSLRVTNVVRKYLAGKSAIEETGGNT